jgi:cytoskeletal protein CcmA (bactofilin family)
MESAAITIIDAHADIDGTLKGKDAQILGKFRGQVELTGRLVLGEGSRVEARVSADAVEIAGEFKGDLKARTLSVLEKGRVEGTIDAQRLAIREGALLNGQVNAGEVRPAPARASFTPAAATGQAAG